MKGEQKGSIGGDAKNQEWTHGERKWQTREKVYRGDAKMRSQPTRKRLGKVEFWKHRKRCLGQARRGLGRMREAKRLAKKRKVVKEMIRKVEFWKHRKLCLGQARRGLGRMREAKRLAKKRKVVKEKVKEKSVRETRKNAKSIRKWLWKRIAKNHST